MKKRNIFRKYIFTKSFFLLALIFCINLFLRKKVPASYAQVAGYNQLYYDNDKTHINKIDIVDDSLELSFQGKDLNQQKNDFRIFVNGTLISERKISGKVLRLQPPQTGRSLVAISINGSADTLSANIDYSKGSPDSKNDEPTGSSYEISSDNLIDQGPLHSVKDWAIDYWPGDTMQVAEKTATLLRDSIKILKDDSSQQKILKIANYILARTGRYKGRPDDLISTLHPLQQLNYVQAGKSKIWCGNYASIFSFLASSSGLPVRLVSCGRSGNQYSTGIHVFCEVYLKEYQSWAFVDLMSGNILVRYNNKWLNTIDIHRLLKYDLKDSNLVAYYYENDTLYNKPFYKVSDYIGYYFSAGNIFSFYYGHFLKIMTPENLFDRGIKFFYTRPYYAVYSDNATANNYLFYLRILTNYLLALLSFFCLLRLILGLKNEYREGTSK